MKKLHTLYTDAIVPLFPFSFLCPNISDFYICYEFGNKKKYLVFWFQDVSYFFFRHWYIIIRALLIFDFIQCGETNKHLLYMNVKFVLALELKPIHPRFFGAWVYQRATGPLITHWQDARQLKYDFYNWFLPYAWRWS